MCKLTAVIHEAEEGGYWAEVPGLPGCMTQGETESEVQANLLEALSGWLDTAREIAMESVRAEQEHVSPGHFGARLVELPV